MIVNNGTSWYLRNDLKHWGHWPSSSWLAPKGAVFCNWLYSPRRNLRLFTWSFSTWYLNKPPREKVFPQHLTVPGHFVSSTTYILHPISLFFSPPMTCLFLVIMQGIELTDDIVMTTLNLEIDWGTHKFWCNSRQKQLIAVVDKSLS